MKLCKIFRGGGGPFMELLTSQRQLKCDPNYNLQYLETSCLIIIYFHIISSIKNISILNVKILNR